MKCLVFSSLAAAGCLDRPTHEAAPSPATVAAPGPRIYGIPVADSPVQGPADAILTVVVFGDYACPHTVASREKLDALVAKYPGEIKVAFKFYPNAAKPNSYAAAELAAAARDDAAFWNFHDKLMALGAELTPQGIEEAAATSGINVRRAKARVEAGIAREIMYADTALAAKFGIGGTPTYVINGAKIWGNQPLEDFLEIVEERRAVAETMMAAGIAKTDVYASILRGAIEEYVPPHLQQRDDRRVSIRANDGRPTLGAAEPEIELIEFADLTCQFSQMERIIVNQLLESYGDRVSFTFRHAFDPKDEDAMMAAKALEAASLQGAHWPALETLFVHREIISKDIVDREMRRLGLDIERFWRDFDSDAVTTAVDRDLADSIKFGVTGTPTFYMNGKPIRGAFTRPKFERKIEEELELVRKLRESGTPREAIHAKLVAMERAADDSGQASGTN
ncbi:MAG: thioredoxin domain-containing protein [Myxococcales bacterium]|nr:thioredoxin domain-containing protein [Myxococcales bacterium]